MCFRHNSTGDWPFHMTQQYVFDRARDPSWPDAWWWLGAPLATALAIWAVHEISPEFYRQHLLPEHTGLLERSHFILPIAGAFIAARMLFYPAVRNWPLLRIAVAFFAIACFYFGMEEESWGQHLFKWETPTTWGEINRQNETNLHNTSYYFNQLLQSILLAAVIVGGVLLPLAVWLRGPTGVPLIDILIPPLALVPVALTTMLFKYLQRLEKDSDVSWLSRPSEATETFFSMFMLFYLIMLARRTRTLMA